MFINIEHDIFDSAVKDPAEGVDRVGADALISLETGDLGGTDAILFNQRILGNSLLFHSFPQGVIADHTSTSLACMITKIGI